MNEIERLASMESEQSVLGGILLDANAMAKCRELTAEMFYLPQHRMIFAALRDMAANRQPIDVITAAGFLENRNQSEDSGGLDYLIELAQNTPSAANIGKWADIIKTRHTERQMLKISAELEQLAFARDGGSIAEKCAKATALISDLNHTAVQEKTDLTAAESAQEMVKHLTAITENGGGLIGISTGITGLDRATNGLQKGNLVIIAARPSMGKTVLAENIARNAAKLGKAVHYQSYEMLQRELVMRAAAAEMNIDFGRLKSARLLPEEYGNLQTFVSMMSGWRLSIDTAPLDVESLCLLAADKHLNGGLDLLVIDHLHLMPFSGNGNETAELGHITKRLKRLAMELEIPVVLVAQLNRFVAKQQDKRPSMADIRGSGSVEQDANIIIMPHRESYYHSDANPNEAELIIAKNRDGEMRPVICGWEGQHQRFVNHIPHWSRPSRDWEPDYAD